MAGSMETPSSVIDTMHYHARLKRREMHQKRLVEEHNRIQSSQARWLASGGTIGVLDALVPVHHIADESDGFYSDRKHNKPSPPSVGGDTTARGRRVATLKAVVRSYHNTTRMVAHNPWRQLFTNLDPAGNAVAAAAAVAPTAGAASEVNHLSRTNPYNAHAAGVRRRTSPHRQRDKLKHLIAMGVSGGARAGVSGESTSQSTVAASETAALVLADLKRSLTTHDKRALASLLYSHAQHKLAAIRAHHTDPTQRPFAIAGAGGGTLPSQSLAAALRREEAALAAANEASDAKRRADEAELTRQLQLQMTLHAPPQTTTAAGPGSPPPAPMIITVDTTAASGTATPAAVHTPSAAAGGGKSGLSTTTTPRGEGLLLLPPGADGGWSEPPTPNNGLAGAAPITPTANGGASTTGTAAVATASTPSASAKPAAPPTTTVGSGVMVPIPAPLSAVSPRPLTMPAAATTAAATSQPPAPQPASEHVPLPQPPRSAHQYGVLLTPRVAAIAPAPVTAAPMDSHDALVAAWSNNRSFIDIERIRLSRTFAFRDEKSAPASTAGSSSAASQTSSAATTPRATTAGGGGVIKTKTPRSGAMRVAPQRHRVLDTKKGHTYTAGAILKTNTASAAGAAGSGTSSSPQTLAAPAASSTAGSVLHLPALPAVAARPEYTSY